jgi:hypothetical protein
MTPAEALDVLARAAAYDQRTAGRADAEAWAAALPDVPPGPAIEAVVAWYREHRERVMPSDVLAHYRGTAASRHPSSRPVPVLPPLPVVPSLQAQANRARIGRIIADIAAKRSLPGEPPPADREATA